MAEPPSNETILRQLKNGAIKFELVPSPVRSISGHSSESQSFLYGGSRSRFFARIGPPLGKSSPAARKVEHYTVQKVAGDGRCMFRALVKGMAKNKGVTLSPREEREDAGAGSRSPSDCADDLRTAVKEVICQDPKERRHYEEALVAITAEDSLKRYCQRIERSDFWGGESELLVLSKLIHQPIIVYIPEHEHTRGGFTSGFIPIAEYGAQFRKGFGKITGSEVVRLVYSGRNHYDLLV